MEFKVDDRVLIKQIIEVPEEIGRMGVVEAVDRDDPKYSYLVRLTLWFRADELEKVSE